MKGDGKLPTEWKEIQLGKVAQLSGRIGWKGLTAKEYTKEGPLFLSVHSLNYGDYVDYRDAFHISQERYDESPEIMLRPGDVLICKDGAGIGKLGIVGDDLPGQTTINSSLLLVRAQEGILPKYLYYILTSPYFQRIVKSRLMGATTPHLYQRDITEFPIYLPPPPEQQRIVAILDETLAGLANVAANVEKNLGNARELFESYLAVLFEQPGVDWIEASFEDCLDDVEYTTKIKRRDFLNEGRFPIISQEADFISGYWNQAKDIFKVASPVVIFGDHTKVLKYVDFDFVLGADGVKILKPSRAWQTRYYQHNAIENALEAIAAGKQRILLTLATGTGKTAIAFQIAWALFQSRWNLSRKPERRPRILFLADRNILADQAYNAFSAFPEDALARIKPDEIKKKGRVPKNASVFFTIFQTFMSGTGSDGQPAPYFGDYPKDFFDFIVIDECHRGGANDESNWRDILDYFSPAVQLGMTATPRRTDNIDTYRYFGDPVYVYSLKEGINDGFLTPFKVKQFATTLDDYVWTPDDKLVEGEIEEGRRYKEPEFNRTIEIEERERYRVKLFMEQIDQREKTLVFCARQSHAALVRDIINQMKTSGDPNYCVRVTAEDGERGEQWLRTFQDNEKTIPTILTTSQKLSTGVDARNVRNIVLMRPIGTMIEFKQIIGRGTRLFDGKDYFTIYDFVKAYEHFNDPEWDGEPIEPVVAEPRIKKPGMDEPDTPLYEPEPPERPKKIKIKLADGKERSIQSMMVTTFWSPDGKPISAAQFVERLFGELPQLFKNEDELRKIWSRPDTRKALLSALADKGFAGEQLAEISRMINAEKSDLFDVLAYIAFALAPITRSERVEARKGAILAPYDAKLQAFLNFVLGQYISQGVGELDQEKLSSLLELKYHSVPDAVDQLGEVPKIRETFVGFQRYLYANELEKPRA